MNELEKTKYKERLEFAIELLQDKFPNITNSELIKEANDIARTLYVRSEVAYSGKK